MANLYFRYGAMGSSKTANALMVAYNYGERGKKALLAKPLTDTREVGVMHSRIGLEQPCISVEELVQMNDAVLKTYDCFIVDEAQFCKKTDIEFFVHIVDDLGIPVICYGLRADFQQNLFEAQQQVELFLFLVQVKVDPTLDAKLAEGNPLLQQLPHAHHPRHAADQDVEIAGKAVLQRGEAVELLHHRVRIGAALEVDGQL